MILVTYSAEPKFPATDQHPDAQRITLGGRWYDYVGAAPTEADIAALTAPTAEDVKAETQRRILALMGASTLEACMIKQLNATMRANELNAIRHDREWTAEEAAEAAALVALAAAIKGIRNRSNDLEAMSPIPADYASNDGYWT